MIKNPYIMGVLLNLGLSFFQSLFVRGSSDAAVISEFTSTSPLWMIGLFWGIVIFIIPVVEELVFRGLLWKIAAFIFSPLFTGISVAVVFSLLHSVDAAVFLLPFALYLSWLRHTENSIKPGIKAHIAFNFTGALFPYLISILPL